MKNIRIFLFENFPILVVKCSIYLNRRVFIMQRTNLMMLMPCFCVCVCAGVILEGDLGEKVFLSWLTSPCLELREKWKCIECIGKSKIWTKTSP